MWACAIFKGVFSRELKNKGSEGLFGLMSSVGSKGVFLFKQCKAAKLCMPVDF